MRKQNTTKVLLALGILAALSAAVFLWQKRSQSNSSQPLMGSQNIARPPNVAMVQVENAVTQRDVEKLKVFLADDVKEEMTLIQILRNLEKNSPSEVDQKVLFDLVFSHMEKENLNPRNRVLGFRIFSNMNLTKSEQSQVRDYFNKSSNKRFKDNLLAASFVKTIPFPADIQSQLLGEIKSAHDISKCVENLYVFSLLKDAKAKSAVAANLSESFFSLNKKIQPMVAKFLVYHSSAEVKEKGAYQKLFKFISTQKTEEYRELGI